MIADDKQIDFEGNNVSTEGLELKLDKIDSALKPGSVVKLIVNDLDVKGVGKIIWINTAEDDTCILGLRYLTIE